MMEASIGQMLNEAVMTKQWHATDLSKSQWQMGSGVQHVVQGVELFRHLKSGAPGRLEGRIYDRKFNCTMWMKDLILICGSVKISTRRPKISKNAHYCRSGTITNGNWLETTMTVPEEYKQIDLNSPESLNQIIGLIDHIESESDTVFANHEDLINEDEDEDRKERNRRRVKVPRRNRGAR